MTDTVKTNKYALYGRIFWIYIKYQIVTKAILGIVLLPAFSAMTNTLIHMSGRTNLSSGDYLGFFFSLYGLPVIVLGILLLVLILGVDINTFIITSSLVEEGKLGLKIKDVFIAALKSVKVFISPLGVLVVLYTAFVMPLLGLGLQMGPLKNFKIPNFITSVIFKNTLYNMLYTVVLLALLLIAFIYIFSLHFILIERTSVREGFRNSRRLMKKYWKRFIKDMIVKVFKLFILSLVIVLIFSLIVLGLDLIFGSYFVNRNVSLIILIMSILEIVTVVAFVSVPIIISFLTQLFYKYNKEEGKNLHMTLVPADKINSIEDFTNKIKKKTKFEIVIIVILALLVNFGTATVMEKYFDELFLVKINKELVAHRAGGDLDAENTVEGMLAAAREGAAWAEIDVQRTKDGEYVLNHDKTFSRIAGDDRTPMEMTLAEIKELEVKNEFDETKPSRKVPTFEEILDAAKGKIGVFVELKEKSADFKMVDDVVKMIEDKGMLDECVILSLDYKIIEYTHDNYPQIKTGFLYFFSVGELKNLKGDYLIMEEQEATAAKIDEIHAAGKKAIVWTVNTPESIDKFVLTSVDGIITDYVLKVKDGIESANNRTHFEILLDVFIE